MQHSTVHISTYQYIPVQYSPCLCVLGLGGIVGWGPADQDTESDSLPPSSLFVGILPSLSISTSLSSSVPHSLILSLCLFLSLSLSLSLPPSVSLPLSLTLPFSLPLSLCVCQCITPSRFVSTLHDARHEMRGRRERK